MIDIKLFSKIKVARNRINRNDDVNKNITYQNNVVKTTNFEMKKTYVKKTFNTF